MRYVRDALLVASRSRLASNVKLFEHSEFEQAIVRAAERFGVNEQFVEKDYYVTDRFGLAD